MKTLLFISIINSRLSITLRLYHYVNSVVSLSKTTFEKTFLAIRWSMETEQTLSIFMSYKFDNSDFTV